MVLGYSLGGRGGQGSDGYFTPHRKDKFQVFKRHKYKNERKKYKRKYIRRYLYDLSIEKEYLHAIQKPNP